MGHRITRAAPYLSVDEIKERMNRDARPWIQQHWWIIDNALVAPRITEEIALHTGVSVTTVHRVISTYNRMGPTALETPGQGGRRHQYLTLQEEEEFLAPFFAQAECGEIATVAQIQHAFEEQVGHEVDDSTIYRRLRRHGWRKLMPRPRHPKADPQIQEQFKKTFQRRWKQQSQHEKLGMNAPFWSWHKMKAALAASAVRSAVGPRQGYVRTYPPRSYESTSMPIPLWHQPLAR